LEEEPQLPHAQTYEEFDRIIEAFLDKHR
jgi:hypothetical protein